MGVPPVQPAILLGNHCLGQRKRPHQVLPGLLNLEPLKLTCHIEFEQESLPKHVVKEPSMLHFAVFRFALKSMLLAVKKEQLWALFVLSAPVLTELSWLRSLDVLVLRSSFDPQSRRVEYESCFASEKTDKNADLPNRSKDPRNRPRRK